MAAAIRPVAGPARDLCPSGRRRRAASSRRCCGWRGRAAPGGWCRARAAVGTASTSGSRVGGRRGVWAALMDQLASDADLEWVMLDSTVVRAHACAAGAKAPAGRRSAAARRLSTKLHAAGDALGNPLAFHLTAGRQGDAAGLPLLDGITTTAVIADKAYDTDAILQVVAASRTRGDPTICHPRPPTRDRLAALPAAPQDRDPVRLHEALPARLRQLRSWRAAISPSSTSPPLASCYGRMSTEHRPPNPLKRLVGAQGPNLGPAD